VHTAYGPNWERLVTLKRRWDPDNVFHLNQNIPPSG
jgi:FAD/FMN-containing dehydrogenase